MTAVPGTAAIPRSRWIWAFLVATHASLISWPVATTVIGIGISRYPHPLPPILTGAAAGAIQLRHSVASARGERPRAGWWTLIALVALVYPPMLWFGLDRWAIMQALLVASAPMVLRGRAGFTAAVAVVVTSGGLLAIELMRFVPRLGPVTLLYFCLGVPLLVAILGAALYGAAQLVRVLQELQATRTELADLAIGRERLRVSRDLHDLLGQSLSAISLKGDLAVRLLSADTQAARAEIESLTTVARDALRGVRAVARDEHHASLPTELQGAAAVLTAAGIAARIDVDVPDLSLPVAETLAWVLREGVANIIRHSDARTCSISATRRNGTVSLEIVNDAPHPITGEGHGLTGLSERVRALSGTVTAEPTDDGQFRLHVQIPRKGRTP